MPFLDDLPAQRLQQMTDEEFWNYARAQASASSKIPALHNASTEQYLECDLRLGTCLIALSFIQEVLPPPQLIARLPQVPSWMAGVVAWRGEPVAVIHLERYVFDNDDEPAGSSMLLIVTCEDITLGLLVANIGPTMALPVHNPEAQTEVVRGKHENSLILDIPLLLVDAMQQIEAGAEYA
ncbi:MAG TPA: chemotaxis protein CheW [Ktedonobacteraceae bacterium]|jgi:chemotaxis signal transduction protein|nr:chemotaxis protein CheW [Ktedonobacteraceae bacterium]